MTDLKPCPFCGGHNLDTETPWRCIICGDCGASDTSHPDDYCTEESVRAAWNRRASPWRPITTAPKDGSVILVWSDGSVWRCRWRDERYHKKPRPHWSIKADNDVRYQRANPPSWWMPLPEPPPSDERAATVIGTHDPLDDARSDAAALNKCNLRLGAKVTALESEVSRLRAIIMAHEDDHDDYNPAEPT